MTIKSDKSKVTLDFECEIGKEEYLVKFHYTDELGQTISICDKSNSIEHTVYTGYPVELFTEIVDFLRSQKVIGNNNNSVPTMSVSHEITLPQNVEKKKTLLPVPDIIESQAEENMDEGKRKESFEGVVADGEPVQSFSSSFGEKKVEVSLPDKEVHKKPLAINDLDVDNPEILAARQKAVERASKSNKAIKPRHDRDIEME